MAEVVKGACISCGEENNATHNCNGECVYVNKSNEDSQDNALLDETAVEETNSSANFELQTGNIKVKEGASYDFVYPNAKFLSEIDGEKSLLITTAFGIFKTDGTMFTGSIEVEHGIDSSEEFKPDSIDKQVENENFDVKDLNSDYGDDDDDFSYWLEVSDVTYDESAESRMTDSDLTSLKDNMHIDIGDTDMNQDNAKYYKGKSYSRSKVGTKREPKSTRNEVVKCPQCDKCISRRNLNDHINVSHTKKTKYHCELCQEGFFTASRMRRHKLFKHKIGFKYIECKECTYKTPYYSTFKRHVLSHQRNSSEGTGVMSYACELCGKLLATADSLRVHLKAHKNGKPFTCTRCEKRFSQKGNLKTHMEHHVREDQKNYEQKKLIERLEPGEAKKYKKVMSVYMCDQCEKVFRWPGDLCRHKKVIHLGIKKFTCDKCQKQFANKHQLQEHALWHSNLKPFPCTACHKRFRSKYRLKYHYMKCHDKLFLDGIFKNTYNTSKSNTSSQPSDLQLNDD